MTDADNLEQAKYFWVEYKYRHDMIWQRIILVTPVIVLISIIPYIKPEITATLGSWILLAPALAFLLAVFMILVLKNELDLFWTIKQAYRRKQNELLDSDLKHQLDHVSDFETYIRMYFIILGMLIVANGAIIYWVWLPGLARSICVFA